MARPKVDYSFGPGHGPVSGAVNAAGAVLAGSMVADLASVPPAWGVIGGVMAAAGAVLSVDRPAPGGVIAYRAGCWLCAGAWSTWAMWGDVAGLGHGPWSTNALAALAVGTVGAAFAGLGFRRADRREEAARKEAVAAELARLDGSRPATGDRADLNGIAAEWRARIERVCHVTLNEQDGIVGVAMWDGEPCPGFTLDGNTPAGGSSWKTIKNYEEDLASDARLPKGCSVKVRPGVDRGAFLVDVMLRNALAENKNYPRTYPHETINDPRLLVYRANDEPVKVSLRQDIPLVVGPTGSGKTVTMNMLIAEVLKCVDVIPCVIDFNGGSLAIPWLMSWRENPEQCPRPPIAWVADTPQKALVMTEAILDVVKDRKQAYAHLKVAANETLLPISAEIPQFELIVDELAEITGSAAQRDPIVRQVADNIAEIMRIGRDAGGRLMLSSLGATNDTLGSRAIKIHSKIKLGMAGTPADELGYLMDDYKMSPEDAEWEGSAHVKLRQEATFIGKVPYLRPDQISEIAIATSDRRPDPDDRALQVMGERWTRRWDNSTELLELLDAGVRALRAGQPADAVVSTAAANRSGAGGQDSTPRRPDREQTKPLGEALADLEAARRRLHEIEPVPDPGPRESELPPLPEEPDWGQVESWLREGEPATTADGKTKPHPRVRMHQLVWDAGDAGIGPSAVHRALEAEGYGTTHQTVNGWMKADAAKGLLAQPGGDRQPYVRGTKMSNPYEGG